MRRRYWILVTAVLLLAGTVVAGVGDKLPIRNLPVRGGASDPMLTTESAPERPVFPGGSLDTVGVAYQAGNTWYDLQHNGTTGKMIGVDSAGYVHMVWMKGMNNTNSLRHVFYNVWDPATQTFLMEGSTGVQINSSTRAGYISLATMPSGWVFPAFHEILPGDPNAHTAGAMDFQPRIGAFATTRPEYCQGVGETLELIWPKIAVGRDGTVHVVSTENPASGVAGDPQRIYYSRGTPIWDPNGGTGIEIEWAPGATCGGFTEIDTVMVIAPTVVTSKISDRVAIVWSKSRDDLQNEPSQYNNDLYYIISEDGGLNWQPEVNVTNFIPPTIPCPGDTADCDNDTFRVYTDCDAIFDGADNLHAAFTTCYLYELEGLINIVFSDIWHWDELNQEFSNVAHAYFDSSYWIDPGAWQRAVHRPNLAYDWNTGYLYCAFHRYDPNQVSEGGWPMGDAFVSVSRNCGRSWSEETNVTETIYPTGEPAPAGQCVGERAITVAEQVTYDNNVGYLHMEYVIDRDAGTLAQTEGVAALCPVMYQRIPVDQIPPLPIHAEPVALHIDSTGFPGRGDPNWDPAAVAPCLFDAVDPSDPSLRPASFALYQNYPNPFNPVTNIQFDLVRDARVTLKVFNTLGQEVATLYDGQMLNAGVQTVAFDAANLASGVYVYRIEVDGNAQSLKMVLMK